MPAAQFYPVIIRKLGQLNGCNLSFIILHNCEESYYPDDLMFTQLENFLEQCTIKVFQFGKSHRNQLYWSKFNHFSSSFYTGLIEDF